MSKWTCGPSNYYHIIFLAKTNLLELEYPYVSYFKVKRQYLNFRKKSMCRPSTEKIFVSRFVIRKLKPLTGEFDSVLSMLKKFCYFWPHASTALRKNCRYFLFQKASSAYLKCPLYLFSDVSSSRPDWDQNLEKCEGGCVGFWDPYFLRETNQKPFKHWTRVNGSKIDLS